MPQEIEVIIEKDGSISLDAMNFSGPDCHEALEKLRRKLGKTVKVKKKKEFNKQTIRNRQENRI